MMTIALHLSQSFALLVHLPAEGRTGSEKCLYSGDLLTGQDEDGRAALPTDALSTTDLNHNGSGAYGTKLGFDVPSPGQLHHFTNSLDLVELSILRWYPWV